MSVENGQRFTQANMTLEFSELDEELKIENAPLADQNNLASTFSEPAGETVSTDGHFPGISPWFGANAPVWRTTLPKFFDFTAVLGELWNPATLQEAEA